MKFEKLVDELIDVDGCAKVLSCSVSKIRKMCMKKEIPHFKVGGKVYFYKPEIIKWISSNKVA